ncbi:MAG: hypothetical protein IJ899_16845 [Blautia sp.]|nr:hypothetical protein [Blautia sp.]
MADRKVIDEENLEHVVGGFFNFNGTNNTMTYYHPDGTVTVHKVLDFKLAWKMSNDLHGQNVPEDNILSQMVSAGYIID